MKRWLPAALAAALLCVPTTQAVAADDLGLDVYTVTATAEQASDLAEQGVDIAAQRQSAAGTELDLVLDQAGAQNLIKTGLKPALKRVQGGLSVKQFALREAAAGFNVYRSWDEPGGIRDELLKVAKDNPDIVRLISLGKSRHGRDILALRVTENAKKGADGSKPSVLYSATQHAREWMATEMDRRLLRWYIDRYRAKDKDVRKILKDSELWFVPVMNPDGYQFSFDHERLWRKTLRDNNGDGQITTGDGVDPNRNFNNHWNYDNEGSSSDFSADSYRGPSAESEPETKVEAAFLRRLRFEFMVNYHTFGKYLLYPTGWQTSYATEDDPIYFSLSGNRDNPAIVGFNPGPGADVLYITNGQIDDYAQDQGTVVWTPELDEGCAGCGFVFPDDEALVQAEFERGIPFAKSVALSAPDPDDPVSSLGIRTKPFYLKSDDPYKDGLPSANFTFDVSYGSPQPVQVLAKRSLGDVDVKYRINGGRVRSADTGAVPDGNKYGVEGTHRYYRVLRGHVRDARKGDTVQVWFESRKEKSDAFTYKQVEDSNHLVLIVAAEDYTGASPLQPGVTAPKYLGYYQDALRRNLLGSDVYDFDARGRKAPSYLGVLSHYKAVVWYTGDDVIPREPTWPGANASRSANDMMLHVREYMNAGGGVLYTGKNASTPYASPQAQRFDPRGDALGPCTLDGGVTVRPGCLILYGSPQSDLINDVLEYWFGVRLVNDNAGTGEDGTLFPVNGTNTPFSWFGGINWTFGGDGAPNPTGDSNSFIPVSALLDEQIYPQHRSFASAAWDRPGGAFAPHTGEYYVYSGIGDVTYKRLTRTIGVPAGGGDLKFWTSYNTEEHWDFLFVEARTPGGSNWTTLPDANGHTSQDTGDSCPAEWRDLHPQLDFYQTFVNDTTCTPTGSGGGAWHAASGDSGGWQEWSIDLDAYAGQQVEISLAYASDWASQGLGVFFDDITLPDGTSTSFETDLGGWAITGPPPGSGPNSNNFERITAAGFPEGAAITTANGIIMGFGLEGVDGADKRAGIMGRAMLYLLTRR